MHESIHYCFASYLPIAFGDVVSQCSHRFSTKRDPKCNVQVFGRERLGVLERLLCMRRRWGDTTQERFFAAVSFFFRFKYTLATQKAARRVSAIAWTSIVAETGAACEQRAANLLSCLHVPTLAHAVPSVLAVYSCKGPVKGGTARGWRQHPRRMCKLVA